jgi:hypothetical protein
MAIVAGIFQDIHHRIGHVHVVRNIISRFGHSVIPLGADKLEGQEQNQKRYQDISDHRNYFEMCTNEVEFNSPGGIKDIL